MRKLWSWNGNLHFSGCWFWARVKLPSLIPQPICWQKKTAFLPAWLKSPGYRLLTRRRNIPSSVIKYLMDENNLRSRYNAASFSKIPTIDTPCLHMNVDYMGPIQYHTRTYCRISQSLKGARLIFRTFHAPTLKFGTEVSSKFQSDATSIFWHPISWPRDSARSYNKCLKYIKTVFSNSN